MDIKQALAKHGSINKTAAALGIARSTVRERLKKTEDRIIGDLSIPHLPSDNLPVERRIEILCEKFKAKKAAYDANTWFPVTVNDPLPIGLIFFGDPHVDNPGANWPLLQSHCALASKTPGAYGVNIGDTTDNWAGSLARLYANNSVSLKEARELAEWFMHDSGVRWLVWLLGNHDSWGRSLIF